MIELVAEEGRPLMPGRNCEVVAEVPDELVARYRAAMAEFRAVQEALWALPEWVAYVETWR